MSTQLETNLNDILYQKATYLIPENIKKGVTILGVTGTYEGEEISWVQSDGNVYINTGITPTNNTKVVMTISNVVNNDKMIMSATSEWDASRFLLTKYNNKFSWYYTGEQVINVSPDTQHTISLFRGEVIVDNSTVYSDTTERTLTSLTPIYIFNSPLLTNRGNIFKLYSFKIYEDNVLIADYVPAKRNGVIGLYDAINEEFLTGVGGTLIAG